MKGYLAMFAVAIAFGLFGILINYNDFMFGMFFQVFLRNFLALFLLAGVILYKRHPIKLTKKDFRILLLYSLITVIAFTSVSFALVNSDIKEVLAFRYVTIVLLSLPISGIFLREKLTSINYVAGALSLAGILIFAFPFHGLSMGNIYSIITAVTFLASNVIIKNYNFSSEKLMLFEFSTISLVLGAVILVTNQPTLKEFHMISALSMIVFPILLIVVTYWIVYGFRNTNFNLANIIMTSEIFFGLLFGYILLKQKISLQEMLGISLIFIAATLPHIIHLFSTKEKPILSE